MSVRILKNLGRYNWASNDKDWLVQVFLPVGAPQSSVSETWPQDKEPDTDGLPPSDVIEIISERVESYLMSTSREETRKTIVWCREHADELNFDWAKGQIEICQKKIERLNAEIEKLGRYVISVKEAQ